MPHPAMGPLPEPELHLLVLAGGDGTRLQELTRRITGAPIPKQYCRILSDRSLLETTLDRVAPLAPPARTMAVVNANHLPVAASQLQAVAPENVLVQPGNRDIGPGLLFSLLSLARRQPRARVAVFSERPLREQRARLPQSCTADGPPRRGPTPPTPRGHDVTNRSLEG